MTSNVTEFQHHLKLILDKPVSRKVCRLFVKLIHQTGPDHVLKPVEMYDDVGEVVTRYYVTRKRKNKFVVVVPLMRNLTDKEIEKIIVVWNARFDDDYILESSTPYTGEAAPENDDEGETPDPFLNKDLREWHARWHQSLVEDGWRYGDKYDRSEKVHPMLLPWEQLPRSYKESYSGMLAGILERSEK